jgi:cyclic lactone autoinducer peptide
MLKVIAKLASVGLTLIAVASVSTASTWWHNPVPDELLKK